MGGHAVNSGESPVIGRAIWSLPWQLDHALEDRVSEQELAIPQDAQTTAKSAAEAFRVELRNRLARMGELARKGGASASYLEQLRGNSETILAAVDANIARSRDSRN